MEQVVYLSLVTASISFTITEMKLFAPLRDWAKVKGGFLGEMMHCGYCLGHWVALVLVLILQPRLFETWWLLDYLLTAMTIAWIASFQWLLMSWLFTLKGE